MEMKLLSLALNAGAQKGEIETAAVKVIYSLRKRGITVADMGKVSTGGGGARSNSAGDKVDWGDTVMNFGKHKGQKISSLDPTYLMWILDWINEEEEREVRFAYLKTSIKNFLRT